MTKVSLLLVVCACMLAVTAAGCQTGPAYSATLTGADVVPPIKSDASGMATFLDSKEGDELRYKVEVKGLKNVTGVKLTMWREGQAGDTVATLWDGPQREAAFTGKLAEGVLTSADLRGPLQGKTMAELVGHIKEGHIYLLVTTMQNKDGELRGKVK